MLFLFMRQRWRIWPSLFVYVTTSNRVTCATKQGHWLGLMYRYRMRFIRAGFRCAIRCARGGARMAIERLPHAAERLLSTLPVLRAIWRVAAAQAAHVERVERSVAPVEESCGGESMRDDRWRQ